MIYIVSTS